MAPVECDIRVINLVNPFYAAAAHVFTASPSSPSSSLFLTEGRRGDIYATSTTHPICAPLGLTSSSYRCKFPVHTSCKRQSPTFEHRIGIPNPHKVAELYAAIDAACALSPNAVQICLIRARRPTEASARGGTQARCLVCGMCCCTNTHTGDFGTSGRGKDRWRR